MTRPPDHVEVVCSHCGTVFTTYLRPHSDHEPDGWPAEAGAAGAPACPECGTVPAERDRLGPAAATSAVRG